MKLPSFLARGVISAAWFCCLAVSLSACISTPPPQQMTSAVSQYERRQVTDHEYFEIKPPTTCDKGVLYFVDTVKATRLVVLNFRNGATFREGTMQALVIIGLSDYTNLLLPSTKDADWKSLQKFISAPRLASTVGKAPCPNSPE